MELTSSSMRGSWEANVLHCTLNGSFDPWTVCESVDSFLVDMELFEEEEGSATFWSTDGDARWSDGEREGSIGFTLELCDPE